MRKAGLSGTKVLKELEEAGRPHEVVQAICSSEFKLRYFLYNFYVQYHIPLSLLYILETILRTILFQRYWQLIKTVVPSSSSESVLLKQKGLLA